MCGRINETVLPEWADYVAAVGFERWGEIRPRYNAPPTATLACVRVEDDQRTAFAAKWGLIPSWSKDAKIGASCSNARSETVDTKPAFRSAYKSRRCLVLATGFYEWDQFHVTKGEPKQPYYFTLKDGKPWTFAGLWESWQSSPDVDRIETCTIITTGPNSIMAPFHDRTPVQMPPDLWESWLDPKADPAKLKLLLTPYDSERIKYWPVSTRVNSTRNEGADLIEPVNVSTLFP